MFPLKGDLCSSCAKQFNLDEIYTSKDQFLCEAGSTPEWESSECPLCKLLWQMRPDKYLAKCGKDTVYAISASHLPLVRDETQPSRPTQTSLGYGVPFIQVGLFDRKSHGRTQYPGVEKEKGHIASIDQGSIPPVGRLVSPDSIDFDILKGWLNYCDEKHTATCGAAANSSLSYLYVIDCVSQRIVRLSAPVKDRFVALSYVWGKQTTASSDDQRSFSSGMLPSNIPNVVRDAITATKNLNCLYLWVDRYCIDQNNPLEKHDQIANMHSIYQNAWVTIIAAAGEDASFGLPGISSRPRLPQPSAKIGNRLLVSTLPELTVVLDSSTWITRGWTYQEGILSKRRLFFTEYQVYYECESYTFRESLRQSIHTHNGRTGSIDGKIYQMDGYRMDSRKVMTNITEYTLRKLSYPSDIYDAISAIFGVYETNKYPIHHIWGLPVAKSANLRGCPPPPPSIPSPDSSVAPSGRRGYAVQSPPQKPANGERFPDDHPKALIQTILCALCWSSDQPCTRRDGYPSWTWLGWVGPIGKSLATVEPEENVEIFLELNGQKVDWDQLEGCLHGKLNFGRSLYLKGSTILCSFAYTFIDLPREKGPRWWATFRCVSKCVAYMRFHLVKKADPGSVFYERLCNQQFTGIIIGHEAARSGPPLRTKYCPVVLVVEKIESKYERIGYFDFRKHTYLPMLKDEERVTYKNSYRPPEEIARAEVVLSKTGVKEITII